MADALKVKIMTKVTGMRSEKKLQDVLKCVEKIIDTPGQSQLALVKTPRPPAGLSQNKRPHDDSKDRASGDTILKIPAIFTVKVT